MKLNRPPANPTRQRDFRRAEVGIGNHVASISDARCCAWPPRKRVVVGFEKLKLCGDKLGDAWKGLIVGRLCGNGKVVAIASSRKRKAVAGSMRDICAPLLATASTGTRGHVIVGIASGMSLLSSMGEGVLVSGAATHGVHEMKDKVLTGVVPCIVVILTPLTPDSIRLTVRRLNHSCY